MPITVLVWVVSSIFATELDLENKNFDSTKTREKEDQPNEALKFVLDPVIIVTGYGFLYNIYEILGSVDIITSQKNNEDNIKTLDDLKAKVGGGSFQNNNAAGNNYIFILGVGNDNKKNAYFNYNHVFSPYLGMGASFNIDTDNGWLTSGP